MNDLAVRLVLAIPLAATILYFLFNYLFSTFGYTELKIDREKFNLSYILFGLKRQTSGETKDISEARISYYLVAGDEHSTPSAFARCLIVEGTKTKKFGRYIKRIEKEWLVEEINSFLK